MKEIYREHLKPIIVLLAICLVVSAALAGTYAVTQPIINASLEAAALAERQEILPDASGFTKIECGVSNVKSVFADDGGSGYVVTVTTSGYGGAFEVTVGLDPDGRVIAVRVGVNSETPGVGSRATSGEYPAGFVGAKDSADGYDVLSGATVTSKAIKRALNVAFAAYEDVKGGGSK